MQKLNPKVTWLFFIGYLLRLGIVPVAFVFYLLSIVPTEESGSNAFFSALMLSFVINIVAWIVFSYVLAWLARNFYGYKLTDDYFQKDFGIFHRRSVTIPYDIIRHVDTDQSVLARALGLAELRVDTAESSHRKSENRILGLSKDVAESLKNELIKRAHNAKSRENYGR